MSQDTAIETVALEKHYRTARNKPRKQALRGVSLKIPRGAVYGLLGPNGAGKTTTLKIIMNFLRPDAGTVALLGEDWRNPACRAKVGFLPEQPYFNMYLTPRKLLAFYGSLFGMAPAHVAKETERLLDVVGLDGSADIILQKFSRGMLQRVGFAQAMLNSPEVLVLDEPSTGLDPIAQFEIKELMLDLRSRGVTIFLSSHQLSEVEALCDQVSVLNAGLVLAEGSLDSLLSVSDDREITLGTAVGELPRELRDLGAARGEDGLAISAPPAALYPVLEWLKAEGVPLLEVRERRATLEEFFMRTIREAAGEVRA